MPKSNTKNSNRNKCIFNSVGIFGITGNCKT